MTTFEMVENLLSCREVKSLPIEIATQRFIKAERGFG
jgi:hypothetical protein